MLYTEDNKISMVVDWILTEKCNLNCYYCLQHADTRKKECNPIDSTFLTKFENTCLFHLTGGEPFLVPNLIELVNEIQTQGHYVSMNTNLTRTTENFAKLIRKDKFLFMNASYHYVYRKKHIAPFVRNYMKIREAGIFIYATIVMIPNLFDELLSVADMLIDKGVFVLPKLMRGRDNKKDYPQDYSVDELDKIKHLIVKSKLNLSEEEKNLFSIVCEYNISIDDWQIGTHRTGTRCFDGKNYTRITEKGDVVYCNGLCIGNVYENNFQFKIHESKENCPHKGINNLCKMNY